MIVEISLNRTITIGVVADTHIPDRVRSLHPGLIPAMGERQVDAIFHAGDISAGWVLSDLETVAPVYAVTGNRDLLLSWKVPHIQHFVLNGVRMTLLHGHINPFVYWTDKVQYVTRGYNLERYINRFPKVDPCAQVVIFGHTHHPANVQRDGVTYFNPGSPTTGDLPDFRLSFGIIRVAVNGTMSSEVVPLTGLKVVRGDWVES